MSLNTLFLYAIGIMLLGGVAYWQFFVHPYTPVPATDSDPGVYTDAGFGFSFHYPVGTEITESQTFDATEFPGGTVVKTIQVGAPGDVLVYEVQSRGASITDEPNGHASPIAQTKYFYDATTGDWMAAFPEGRDGGGSAATTTARAAGQTNGGLPILPSGRRFDTVIIPLAPTKFVVVTSGGGAGTSDIAQSVAPAP